jgi:hypothetical protein
MLAVCSDLDETPSRQAYWEIMRYLNTTETTSMGPGVGLEVGNTIYFDMEPDQFAYWNTDDAGREMVRTLIRSGHIDCLHSYGDLATTRSHAGRALDELTRHDCHLNVWIDHAVAPTNFGADIMKGLGDVPGSEAYHADLTCDYGIQYVWRGRVTSVVGQNVRRSLTGILDSRQPARSAKTLGKEALKGVLARCGSAKYAMHGPNNLTRRVSLRDGRPVTEFMRSNPYWGGVQNGATADGLADVLTDRFLRTLQERESIGILYTHLGKTRMNPEPLGSRTREALRNLAEHHRKGDVLVTTTRRVLEFEQAVGEIRPVACHCGGTLQIDLRSPDGQNPGAFPSSSLAGLTFYVDDPDSARLMINGRDVEGVRRNPTDHTGRPSISFPWPEPEFPSL